jgi:hypothetical protein
MASSLISEARLQSDCFLHAHNEYPQIRGLLFMVNNEVPKLPYETKKQWMQRVSRLRAMGLIPGVCDLLLIYPLNCFEFKLPGETQSPEQQSFQAKCKLAGIPYFIVETFEQWQELIQKILKA